MQLAAKSSNQQINGALGLRKSSLVRRRAANIIDVAFSHPIKLIANALGVPPRYMLDMGKERGVVVAALIGALCRATRTSTPPHPSLHSQSRNTLEFAQVVAYEG